MKASKISMAMVIAAAAFSFGANAATGNSGKVTFHGSVVDAPCNLAPGQDGEDIKVDFGQLSMSQLNAGQTAAQVFEIQLENCDLGEGPTAKTAEITFTSPEQISGKNLIATNGLAKNLAIGIDKITLGTPAPIAGMVSGNNTLTYTAIAQKADAADVTAGDFAASTNFQIAYK